MGCFRDSQLVMRCHGTEVDDKGFCYCGEEEVDPRICLEIEFCAPYPAMVDLDGNLDLFK